MENGVMDRLKLGDMEKLWRTLRWLDEKLGNFEESSRTLRWMDQKLGDSEKVCAEENLTEIVTVGVRTEEKLCKSIMKGFARRN